MFDVLKKLWRILSARTRVAAVFLVAGMVAAAMLELIALALLMPAVSAFAEPKLLETNRVLHALYSFSGAGSVRAFILVSAIALIGFYLLKNAFGLILVRIQSRFAMRLSDFIALSLYRKYIAAPYRVFADGSVTELAVRINRVYELTGELLLPLLLVCSETLVFLFIACAVCVAAPMVAAFAAGAGAFALALFYLPLKRRMERLGEENHRAAVGLMAALEQSFESVETIRLTGSEKYFADAFARLQGARALAQKRVSDIGQTPRFAMEFFGVFLAMGVMILFVLTEMPFSDAAVAAAFFAAALFRLTPCVSRIQYNLLHIRAGKFLFSQLYEDLTAFPSEALPVTRPEIPFERELKLTDVSFSYGRGRVFEHFDLTLRKNESLALAGPTGCGKSTLARLISGFLRPDSGRIESDGVAIAENLPRWQSKIGLVPQKIFLLDASVRENVAFGVPPAEIDTERVRESLAEAQILDFIESLPDGLDTCAGENGVRFSGGQRQRIAIARALYRKPELLILDEATSALDDGTESAFLDVLRALRGRITILMIAHRSSGLALCDRTVRLGECP